MVRAIGQAAAGATIGTIEVVLRSRTVAAVADHVLERVVTIMLESPSIDRAVERVLDSPQAERLVARVIDGPLLEEAIERLLASDELWLLVDEVARSPSVTEAISHQGVGLADEVVDVARRHSVRADDRLERIARRLLHRRAATPVPPAPEPLPGS